MQIPGGRGYDYEQLQIGPLTMSMGIATHKLNGHQYIALVQKQGQNQSKTSISKIKMSKINVQTCEC